ncbi:MAG: OsmC family protein [Candidatus Dormibacteria bacterium]
MERNGISVDQLNETIEAVKAQPELARFQFRSKTKWEGGGHSEARIQAFYGTGHEDSSRGDPFVIVSDEPPVLLGTNHGPNAVELVLAALASCLTVSIVYCAAASDITVQELTLTLEGDLDLHGFLGLSETMRPGYEGIQVRYHLVSDASVEQLADLMTHAKAISPVLDIVRNPVPVTFIAD